MFDIATRAQAGLLKALGETLAIIQQQTGITQRQAWNIHKEAQNRGWSPGTPLLDKHVKDNLKDRSGRKRMITPTVEQAVVDAVTKDQYGREKTLVELGSQFNISSQSVLRILHKHNFGKPSQQENLVSPEI